MAVTVAGGTTTKAARARARATAGAVALAVSVMALTAAVGLCLLYVGGPFALGPLGDKVLVRVPDGASASHIAAILRQEGLIGSERLFRLAVRALGKASALKSGEYQFVRGDSMATIIERISSGKVVTIRITVPEGMTAKQIASLFSERGIASEDDFIALVDEPTDQLRADFPFIPCGVSLEGYLFPDTYEFAGGVGAMKAIRAMLKRFEKTAQAALDTGAGLRLPNGLTQREALILASIVEREARVEGERPIIAKVFLNRLERPMPLQSCATIQYILPAPKERLLNEDLQVESPYNTYRQTGLPPGPICNPGLASIRAVLEPEPVDYLYFVASDDGSHVFSLTYREHLLAKARIDRGAGAGN